MGELVFKVCGDEQGSRCSCRLSCWNTPACELPNGLGFPGFLAHSVVVAAIISRRADVILDGIKLGLVLRICQIFRCPNTSF